MTRDEHELSAERLLSGRRRFGPWADGSGSYVEPPSADEIAQAQVHATLALAAAVDEIRSVSDAAKVSDLLDGDLPDGLKIRSAVPR